MTQLIQIGFHVTFIPLRKDEDDKENSLELHEFKEEYRVQSADGPNV